MSQERDILHFLVKLVVIPLNSLLKPRNCLLLIKLRKGVGGECASFPELPGINNNTETVLNITLYGL